MLVHKLIEERNNLVNIANIDALSGLNNRRGLNQIGNVSGLLLIDIDNFKNINDNFGHTVGDEVIKEVANSIKSNIRTTDFACRWGGDEFLVTFNNCPKEIIVERAKKISNDFAQNSSYSFTGATISVGVVINKENDKLNDMIDKADKALYESKRNGKGQVIEFDFDETDFTKSSMRSF